MNHRSPLLLRFLTFYFGQVAAEDSTATTYTACRMLRNKSDAEVIAEIGIDAENVEAFRKCVEGIRKAHGDEMRLTDLAAELDETMRRIAFIWEMPTEQAAVERAAEEAAVKIAKLREALKECLTDAGARAMTDESQNAAEYARRRLTEVNRVASEALAKANPDPELEWHGITVAERDTILGALRYYQNCGMTEPQNRPDWLQEIVTPDIDSTSLDAEGIDRLCETINFGERDDEDEDQDEDQETK